MRSKFLILLALAVLCASQSRDQANAAPTSGDDLLRICRSSETGADAGFCRGYIQAMMDAIADNPELGCMPAEGSIDQIRYAVVNHLTKYPETRNFPAYVAVANALSRIYSCKPIQERGPSSKAP